jgi:hypothetical protein
MEAVATWLSDDGVRVIYRVNNMRKKEEKSWIQVTKFLDHVNQEDKSGDFQVGNVSSRGWKPNPSDSQIPTRTAGRTLWQAFNIFNDAHCKSTLTRPRHSPNCWWTVNGHFGRTRDVRLFVTNNIARPTEVELPQKNLDHTHKVAKGTMASWHAQCGIIRGRSALHCMGKHRKRLISILAKQKPWSQKLKQNWQSSATPTRLKFIKIDRGVASPHRGQCDYFRTIVFFLIDSRILLNPCRAFSPNIFNANTHALAKECAFGGFTKMALLLASMAQNLSKPRLLERE